MELVEFELVDESPDVVVDSVVEDSLVVEDPDVVDSGVVSVVSVTGVVSFFTLETTVD